MSINERIQTLINIAFNGNKRAFSNAIGVGATVIQNIVGTRQGKPSYGVIEAICANANVSPEWLISGNGDMLKTKSTPAHPNSQEAAASSGKVTNNKGISKKEEVEIKPIHEPRCFEHKLDNQEVYLYDFQATAGITSLFDNNTNNIIDILRIPNMPICDGAIRITGNSMFPVLSSGDIIAYRQQTILNISDIYFGQMYLIGYDDNGDDYVVVKIVKQSLQGDDYITLHSYNPEHPDKDIHISSIRAMALVKASVRINSMM